MDGYRYVVVKSGKVQRDINSSFPLEGGSTLRRRGMGVILQVQNLPLSPSPGAKAPTSPLKGEVKGSKENRVDYEVFYANGNYYLDTLILLNPIPSRGLWTCIFDISLGIHFNFLDIFLWYTCEYICLILHYKNVPGFHSIQYRDLIQNYQKVQFLYA